MKFKVKKGLFSYAEIELEPGELTEFSIRDEYLWLSVFDWLKRFIGFKYIKPSKET